MQPDPARPIKGPGDVPITFWRSAAQWTSLPGQGSRLIIDLTALANMTPRAPHQTVLTVEVMFRGGVSGPELSRRTNSLTSLFSWSRNCSEFE